MVASGDWGSERGRLYIASLKEQFINDIKRIPEINYIERSADAENIFRIEVRATPLETFEPDPLNALRMGIAIPQYYGDRLPSNNRSYLGYRFSIFNPYIETESLVDTTYKISNWYGILAPFLSLSSGQTVVARSDQPTSELKAIDEKITQHLPQTSIIDVLTDTEKWLGLHTAFSPLSGNDRRLDEPEKRFITTLFCYGCNLGPTQTARSIKWISRRQVAWLNLRHASEERLDKAIVQVVNAYNKFDLPKYWGTGRHASADGTKWDLYEQNLLSEYHIRYGGYGGIGYYHVSDTYIALFSHFIPCGVYEAVYILDGLMSNKSDIQPDTLHGDTQAQSYPVFGLSYLLGINLMPRIRNIHNLTLFRPDKRYRYKNIDTLFSGSIDFKLIETHLRDMLRVAVSIKKGQISASASQNGYFLVVKASLPKTSAMNNVKSSNTTNSWPIWLFSITLSR